MLDMMEHKKKLLYIYDTNKKKRIFFTVSEYSFNTESLKVEHLFKRILSTLDGKELGCFCAYILICENSFRKALIEYGLKCGFKKVGIIDNLTAGYFSLALQTTYKPKNGDVIWIIDDGACYIWIKKNGRAKFVHSLFYSKETNFDKLFSEIQRIPNAIFFLSNVAFDIKKAKEMFPLCFFDSFSFNTNQAYSAMIKTRIMTNDTKVIEWDAQTVLHWDILILQGMETILKIDEMQPLPISKTLKLKNETASIFVSLCYKDFDISLFREIVGSINIDENGIFSVSFLNAVDEKSASTFFDCISNLQSINPKPSQNNNSIGSTYDITKFKFPSKISTNNNQIEAVGIDLGTSRCCAAVNRRSGIETLSLENAGGRLLPSFVAYDEQHDKCGQIATDRLRHYSKSTVFDAKRIIGRSMNEIQIDPIWSFLISNFNNQILIHVTKGSETTKMNPEEVSASLLGYIKERCEKFQGKSLSKVVVTIPAIFTKSQKDATITAAKLAGWEIVYLLPEPIAASFAYFIERPIPNNSIILLFDLGGGTLDVCISKIENDEIQIISQNGDSQLGGRDFDNVLINYFKNLLVSDFGILMKDKKFKLMIVCQKLKESLSTVEKASLDVDEFDPTKEGVIEMRQTEFETLTFPLLKRIRSTISGALLSVNFKPSNIDKVLLVGGGSRMPMVINLLKEIFPNSEHCCETNPDEVVAVGAAHYAYYTFLNQIL